MRAYAKYWLNERHTNIAARDQSPEHLLKMLQLFVGIVFVLSPRQEEFVSTILTGNDFALKFTIMQTLQQLNIVPEAESSPRQGAGVRAISNQINFVINISAHLDTRVGACRRQTH